MNKLILLIVIMMVVCTIEASIQSKRRKLTEEQKQELIMMKVGGFVVQPIKTTVLKLYNNQGSLDSSVLDDIAANMRKGPNFPVEIYKGAWDTFPVKESGVGFAVELYEDAKDPTKMTCAPDDGWVRVNIAPFKADSPSPKKLSERIRREVWRGVAYSLGAGNTHNPMCPLKAASSIKELDALSGIVPSPEVLDVMVRWAKHWGINAYRKTTYRKACQEGWAPPPTNDYQRVIWEEVKAKPTEPMKIKFDPVQGK